MPRELCRDCRGTGIKLIKDGVLLRVTEAPCITCGSTGLSDDLYESIKREQARDHEDYLNTYTTTFGRN